MAADELSLFCGEQLASRGALRAPLHRVPPPPEQPHGAGAHTPPMPFFARAHPDAVLQPLGRVGSGAAGRAAAGRRGSHAPPSGWSSIRSFAAGRGGSQ